MRTLLAATLLFGLTACTKAQDPAKKPDDKKPDGPTLKVGDPAPPLAVQKWLNGGDIKAIEPGKVYVFDVWATWCGPCIQAMPHLAELQNEYKDQGLRVATVTTITPKNSETAVEKFVERKGSKLGFPFGVCTSKEFEKAWFDAAGAEGLPTSFVVDKTGKIAYIGHPLSLDDVLPKVLAGTWKGQADIDAMNKLEEEIGAAYEKGERDPAGAVVALDALLAKNPTKAAQPTIQVDRVRLMLSAGKIDDAKAATEKLLPVLAAKQNGALLNNVRAIWSSKELNPKGEHLDLATKAADAVLAIEGEKDVLALFGAAEAYFAAGNSAKAVELAEKAIPVAETDEDRAFIKDRIAKYKAK